MIRKILFLTTLFFISSTPFCFSQTRTSSAPGVYVQEEDGVPSARFRRMKFSNKSLTNNGDGSVSVTNNVNSITLCDITDDFCFVYDSITEQLSLYVNGTLQVQFPAEAAVAGKLLLESGDYFLLETGDKMELE